MRNPTVATEGALTPPLSRIVDALEPGAANRVRRVLHRQRRTNLVSEVHLADGVVLVIKQGTSEAARLRFATAHAASTMLHGMQIEIPATRLLLDDEPVLAYRRIDRETLHERWNSASASERDHLLESWGALLHRLHALEIRGVGALVDPVARSSSVAGFLRSDIEGRLAALLREQLPAGVKAGEKLCEFALTLPETRSAIVHNDVFDQNVLCDRTDCTGLLDFEDAFAAPPEADFAKLELLHGPLFGQPWTGAWLDRVRDGYECTLDARMVAAFRCYALLNMSWHGTTIGLVEHSRMLIEVAAAEAALLEHGAAHTEAVHAARVS